jgi:hypothetical protein
MAKSNSTGMKNFVAVSGSAKQGMANGRLLLFSGAQVADGDAVAAGTLLCTLTKAGGAYTAETRARWLATLASATGYINGLILGGLVRTGTLQSGGSATTAKLDAGASATDNFYKGMYLLITAEGEAGKIGYITGYVGSTKVATITAVGTAFSADPGASGTPTFNLVAGINLLSAAVAYSASLATTALAVAAAVNDNVEIPDFTATTDDDDVILIAPVASGTAYNGMDLYAGASGGVTITPAGSGRPSTYGVAAVNGLNQGSVPVAGAVAKETSAWQGTFVAGGTVGWYRYVTDSDDGLSASSTARRSDGTVGTSGADLNLSQLTYVLGDVLTINTAPITIT